MRTPDEEVGSRGTTGATLSLFHSTSCGEDGRMPVGARCRGCGRGAPDSRHGRSSSVVWVGVVPAVVRRGHGLEAGCPGRIRWGADVDCPLVGLGVVLAGQRLAYHPDVGEALGLE